MLEILNKRRIAGVDISDHSIEVLQLEKNGRVVAYGRKILEKGIVEDGKVAQVDKLTKALQEVTRSTKPIKLQPSTEQLEVVLCVPERHNFLHYFEFQGSLKEKEAERKVRAEAAKVIPFDPEGIYWSYVKFTERPAQNAAKVITPILYTAAPKDVVDDYIRAADAARLKVAAIDVEMLSLGRALVRNRFNAEGKDKFILLMDIGAWNTAVGFFDAAGVLYFSAYIPIGGNILSRAIADQLKLSYEEAERMKKELGMDSKANNQIISIIEPYLKRLTEELKELKNYCEKKNQKKVAKILLAGGSGTLRGIEIYLKNNLGLDAEIGNPFFSIKDSVPPPEDLPPIFFANVMGLALRGLEKDPKGAGANLLPKEDYRKIIQVPIERRITDIQAGPLPPPSRPAPPAYSEKSHRLSFMEIFGTFAFALGFVLIAIGFLAIVVYKYILQEGGVQIIRQDSQQFREYIPRGGTPSLPSASIEPPQTERSNEQLSTEDQLPLQQENTTIKSSVLIVSTPTGWLNVREGPGTIYEIVGKVSPGETYPLLQEEAGWFKIELSAGKGGWILKKYASKK